jgi:pimeloyl-ACP methyl ester carboxylesterase
MRIFATLRVLRAAAVGCLVALLLSTSSAMAQAKAGAAIKTIVLVHGAWADGSSWSKVIPLLQAKGYNVVAVQNPVTSLADDVAVTKRALAALDGPVILVGHSWAGVVITEAGVDPKVAGLVYVATPAPDVGQSLGEMGKPFPPPPVGPEFKADAEGFLTISQKGIREDFAQDLPAAETKVLWSVQGTAHARILDEKPTVAAWKTKPSWYVVAAEDRMFSPDLERARAKAINATTVVLKSSHVAMLSHPQEVADVIMEAARKATSTKVSIP